ncbi:hypothetical protein [Sphingomonas sp. BK580]|uniref:hypothetical protein n=1 Tax=Sphingomonas sp. BK580 TaxID=2586972 RepID=UPI00161A8B39|nr:hypothetical protein [Sphingomonas sp. BK580]MBB3693026.1 hypothetical protein [Sphingomonas sp. BK580]
MSLTGKLILAALAAVLAVIFVPPLLATLLVLGFLVGLFGASVALWAVVLLGERWYDEGLGAYNYLDALDDALNDVFRGLRRLFVPKARPSLKSRLVASWPLLSRRLKLAGALTLGSPVLLLGFLGDALRFGFPRALQDLRDLLVRHVPYIWRGERSF